MRRAATLFALVLAILALLAGAAAAHTLGLSSATYTALGATVTVEFAFARRELAGLAPSMDPEHTGVVTPERLAAAAPELEAGIVRRLDVSTDGASCPGALESATLTESDGVTVRARYACPGPTHQITVRAEALFAALPSGHRQIARAEGAGDVLLYLGHDTLTFGGGLEPRDRIGFLPMLRMGIEHILEGYDHLAFVLGLVLVGGRVRSFLAVVTAFTLAHSVTLGLAAFDLVRPPSSVIEPLVALSIAYVGIENFFVKSADRRWRITLPFGLIHGFAFASALRDIELAPAEIPLALVSFNLGVEIGQLMVMAPVLALVGWLQRYDWFGKYVVKGVSAGIVTLAIVLFVERLRA